MAPQIVAPRVAPGASLVVRVNRIRTAFLYAVVPNVLLAVIGPASAQEDPPEMMKWTAKVTYKETYAAPKYHRVKSFDTRFDFSTLQLSQTDYTEKDEWQNVTIAYADSGGWHRDPEDITFETGPATDGWWNYADTLAFPKAGVGYPAPNDLRTRRPHGTIYEVKLPKLPVARAGSIVLVNPSEIGFRYHVTYNHLQHIFTPDQGPDSIDVIAYIQAVQPAPVPGEGVEASEVNADEYEGLTPEVIQALKMMDAMTEGAEGKSEDDQVALMGLKMAGYVEFEGNPVIGSRQWTSTYANPGTYTSDIPDSAGVLSHELKWEFIPK